jgi:ankyrin repeat protein
MRPETLEGLFTSLKFEHIEDRHNNIRVAHADTCRWLLNNEVYQCWLDETHIAQHHGLLWLKGKPGSGKSTLIKFALSKNSIQRREDIHISFFFNARGTLLEKDTRGMYRSLLFQILAKMGKATEVFEEFDMFELPQAPQFSWTIPQLQAVFRRALRKVGRRWLWIYVDALDECDEEQVRDMVDFFRAIGDYSMRANIKMRIFFASRYYPRISTQNKVEMKLEDEQEHFLDIARYVSSELKTGVHTQSAAVERIRQEVIGRASGVFIWVCLVVRILNKAYDHGRIIGLEKKLKEIPNDLSLLFQEILTRDRENVEAMQLCIHWILFARRPLTRQELYYAVHAGTQPEDVGDMYPDNITDEVMDAYILSSSKGLAELTDSKEPVVQFIHETIREFFLKGDGVQHIQGTSNRSLQGIAHDSLRKCCETYISSAEPVLLQHPSTQAYLRRIMGTSGYAGVDPVESHGSLPLQRLPFIEYAVSFILHHANVAEAVDVPQDSFLRRFDVSTWKDIANIVAPWSNPKLGPLLACTKPYSPEWSLLYILAMQDHPSLIVAWKRVKPCATMDEGAPFSPIRVALERWNHNSVRALMTLTWAASPTDFYPSESELNSLMYAYRYCSKQARSSSSISDLLFHWGSEKDVLTLVRCGTFGDSDISTATRHSILAFAVGRGYETVTKFLLSDPHVDCNRQDHFGFTPLIRAAREGRETIVPLLLECAQIDVNLQCSAGRSALSYAADKGQGEICKQLLRHRQTEANLRDKRGRTPFFYASMSGQEAIVDLFLKIDGMDIISRDTISQTALSYAIMNGHKNVANRLLRVKQVDVNSQDNIHGRTPLIFALENGYHSIARLLLSRPDIDVGICTKAGKSPLDFARYEGVQEETDMIARLIRAKRQCTSDSELSEADNWDIDCKEDGSKV